MYGMKLSQLTEELLKEILLLYDKIAGGDVESCCFSAGSPPMDVRLKWLKDGLTHGNAVDWRYGSNLITRSGLPDKDAKLVIWYEKTLWRENTEKDMVIRFAFDPNIVSGPEAEKISEDFKKEMDELLIKWKVNVDLK